MKKLVLIVAGVIFAVLLTSLTEFSPWEFAYIDIAEAIQKGETFKIPLKTRRDTYESPTYEEFYKEFYEEFVPERPDTTDTVFQSDKFVP